LEGQGGGIMIIEIVKTPDVPILDELSEEVKQRLIGFKMQATIIPAFGERSRRFRYTVSRSVHKGDSAYFVSRKNFLGALIEILPELFTRVAAVFPEKSPGIIFGSDEVEVLTQGGSRDGSF
jgi:hypothetical protein